MNWLFVLFLILVILVVVKKSIIIRSSESSESSEYSKDPVPIQNKLEYFKQYASLDQMYYTKNNKHEYLKAIKEIQKKLNY